MAAYHSLHDSNVTALIVFFLLELSSRALLDSESPGTNHFKPNHPKNYSLFFSPQLFDDRVFFPPAVF